MRQRGFIQRPASASVFNTGQGGAGHLGLTTQQRRARGHDENGLPGKSWMCSGLECDNIMQQITVSRHLAGGREQGGSGERRGPHPLPARFLPGPAICGIDWFIGRQASLSVYLELSSNRRLNTACLVLVTFGLHITKFSITVQQCAFSLHTPSSYLPQAGDLHHICLPQFHDTTLPACPHQAVRWTPVCPRRALWMVRAPCAARPSAGRQSPGTTGRGRSSREPSWPGDLVLLVPGMEDPRLRADPTSSPGCPEGHAAVSWETATCMSGLVWAQSRAVSVAPCPCHSAHTG